MSHTCPSCASDNTQKLSLIYNSGTAAFSAATIGVSRGGIGVAATSGMSQSQLAKKYGPPTKKQAGAAGCLVILGLVAGAIAGAIFDSSVAFWIIMAGAFATSFAIGKAAYEFNKDELPQLYARWEKRSLCLRCGDLFEENTLAIIPKADFQTAAPPSLAESSQPSLPESTEPNPKSAFNLRLMSAGARPLKVMQIIRQATGCNLREARNIVENAPGTIKTFEFLEDAENLKQALGEVGASVEIREI